MADASKPRRLVLCIGDDCKSHQQSDAHYERLCEVLGDPNPFNPKYPQMKWTVANCLDHCEEGPNLVIYPDGLWVHELDEDKLEQLIRDEIQPRINNTDS